MGKISRSVKRLRNNVIAIRYVINEEKSYNSSLSFPNKLNCLINGFSSEKYMLYNFSKNSHANYLSDYKRHKTQVINGAYSIVLNDKMLFDKVLADHTVTPKIFGKIKNGTIYLNNTMANICSLMDLLKTEQVLIIKKHNGGGGKGIYRVQYKDDMLVVNNNEISIDEFTNMIVDFEDYMISEHVKQADYSNRIYPGTINTIRVITMRDPETSEIFIPIAVHKFGSKKTEPADNVWRGGLTALVDVESGFIQKPALHHEKNKKIEWVTAHPDTNETIEHVKIPNWDQVKESIIKIATKLDFLHYVGWDLVVTNDGIRIIEGNNYSDVNILQIHQPLLVDARVKRFYQYYGILK